MSQLKNIVPEITEANSLLFDAPYRETIRRYQINTLQRQAAFLANLCIECAYFTRLIENLNYSEKGLLKTFRKYFTIELAKEYARKPQMIANFVYANRGGNGDVKSGDGWKFRGRGAIQTTLKNNYMSLSKEFGIDYVNNPDLLLRPMDACLSAGFYWHSNNLNVLADAGKFEELVGKINKAKLHLAERTEVYNSILKKGIVL